MDALLFTLITGIISVCLVHLSNGSCRPKTQQVAFDVTDRVPKSPLGLQQCERECFSDANCQVMVYDVNSLACYKVMNISSVVTNEGLTFVVKLRSEIAQNLDTSYLCRNHQCENGSSCVALSRGVIVCMGGLCEQPVTIKNAVVNTNSYSISSTATYSCNNGYYSIGTSTITCGSSLEWTDASLVCFKDGFIYDQGTKMMFKVISQWKNYPDALSHCEGFGSGLIKVNTTDKMEVLWRYIDPSGIGYFTDASDRAKEGTWIFSDGSNMYMTLFRLGDPNMGTSGNYAVLGFNEGLYDMFCDTSYHFICEVR